MIFARPYFLILILFFLASPLHAQCYPPDSGKKEIQLFQAIQEHDPATVKTQISEGANVNAADRFGHTLLMCAGISDLNADIVRMLIAAGANTNARLSSGVNVLMYDCGEYKNSSIIDMLIKSGVNIHATDNFGSTALHEAALSGNIDAVMLLIAAGADINAREKSGFTPIDDAKDARKNSKEIVQLLLHAGANPYGIFAPLVVRLNAAKPPQSYRELTQVVEAIAKDIFRFRFPDNSSKKKSAEHIHYDDSLGDANNYLRLYLDKYLPLFPESFDSTEKIKGISTSDDKRMKIWGWDTWLGGSMPTIFNVIEYRTSKGISICDEQEHFSEGNVHDGWYNSISPVKREDGNTYYILISTWKGDGRNWGQSVTAAMIKDTILEYHKIFLKDKDTSASLEYHGPDPTIYRNLEYIKIKHGGKRILIPVLGPNDDPTKDFEPYEFDGRYYKPVPKSRK